MSAAATAWREIFNTGNVTTRDLFKWQAPVWWPNWLPVPTTLEKTYDDGSILRFSDSAGRWFFYDTPQELSWAKKLGRA